MLYTLLQSWYAEIGRPGRSMPVLGGDFQTSVNGKNLLGVNR